MGLKEFGTVPVKKAGNSLQIEVPEAWLVHEKLPTGSTVYSVATIDGRIQFSSKPMSDYDKSSTVGVYNGKPVLRLNAKYCEQLHIVAGSKVDLVADVDGGKLIITPL